MVEKTISKPIPKETTTDDNGIEATDYEDVTTETKAVKAQYQKGVVLKVPHSYANAVNRKDSPEYPIEVGDIIVYDDMFNKEFDIFKDSKLISPFDVVAIVK